VDMPGTNHVTLLEIGADALLARIHLIRSATRSISIQTMIWVNDETGRLLIYELIQAARRGVQVQLLIDHLASEQHLEIAAFLANVHPNFQVKLFNPVVGFLGQLKVEPSVVDKLYALAFNFRRLNQRMHNKTFIVDGLVGLTGGRNYQNAYYDQALGMNYKDRDVLVIGPVVTEMQESFDCYWMYKRAKSLTSLVDVKKYRDHSIAGRWQTRESFQLNGFFDDLDTQANRAGVVFAKLVSPLVAVEQAYFIADDPYKIKRSLFQNDGYGQITLELAGLVTQAKQSVTIQTPYLVLTSPAIALFRQLRKEYPKIDVQISTNSLAATDSWYVYALSYKQKKTYLSDLKFRIYEFKPKPGDMQQFMPTYPQLKSRAAHWSAQQKNGQQSTQQQPDTRNPGQETAEDDWLPAPLERDPYFCVHAKSLVVDEMVSFVGSYNLDPRSENINTECGLVIRDKNFSRTLKALIEADMKPQNSWVIAPKRRLTAIKETNALIVDISNILPFIDPWPFRYSASFELKEGRPPVAVGHPDFYENYRDVGSFPQVRNTDLSKEVGARGTKAFLSFVKPLL
jgi:putative cardiolipin synthase